MSRYTIPERIFIVKTFYESNQSPVTVARAFAKEFKVHSGPDRKTITRLIEKFEHTGSVCDNMRHNVGRKATVSTPENVEKTRELLARSPRKSIRRAAQQVGIKRESLRKIIVNELKLFPYKVQVHQPLSEAAMEQRLEFANDVVGRIDNNTIDVTKVWFSDEAHFHLDGYVNKQNWRIWGSEHPHFAIDRSLHPLRVTVWCAMSTRGIVGAVFVDGTVTSARYCDVLANSFIPAIQGDPEFELMWFMQDGARPHRTSNVFDLLDEHFQNRVIALGYPDHTGMGINWPPYSPDFNPCDFFLWGNLKDKVYSTNPKTVSELKCAIQRQIEAIDVPTLESVMQHFVLRMRHAIARDGRHIEYVIS